ncbi:hypothetical protein [Ponticoccus alexandrii]|nr:hypothetical protein [Ponticoccus alexandrii]
MSYYDHHVLIMLQLGRWAPVGGRPRRRPAPKGADRRYLWVE